MFLPCLVHSCDSDCSWVALGPVGFEIVIFCMSAPLELLNKRHIISLLDWILHTKTSNNILIFCNFHVQYVTYYHVQYDSSFTLLIIWHHRYNVFFCSFLQFLHNQGFLVSISNDNEIQVWLFTLLNFYQ